MQYVYTEAADFSRAQGDIENFLDGFWIKKKEKEKEKEKDPRVTIHNLLSLFSLSILVTFGV